MPPRTRQIAAYVLVISLCYLVALAGGWTAFGTRIDNDAYDFFFGLRAPSRSEPHAAILAIDEESLSQGGGVRGLRRILAAALEEIAPVQPPVVAVDLILPDEGDPVEDRRLAAAMQRIPHLVLASELQPDSSGWVDPLPLFRSHAAAVGHAHASPDETDMVIREIPLEKRSMAPDRRWALALEAFRIYHGVNTLLETPHDLRIGTVAVPASASRGRSLYVSFSAADEGSGFPEVTAIALQRDPARASVFRHKAVFVGVTAQSALSDRWMTPVSSAGAPMPGVVIHASAFETLARGEFLTPARDGTVALVSLALAAAMGFAFALTAGWLSYLLAAALLLVAHLIPYGAFQAGVVFPFLVTVGAAWLPAVGGASFQHFVVRRQLRKSETERSHYQQAVHFVTHELKTPLTAIQGSSELISRYNLTDEKRKQLAQTITSESKRLAQMIETFLNVERLTAGQIDLRKGPIPVNDLVEGCVSRTSRLADRKRIRLTVEPIHGEVIEGDRELIDYAVYNLVTNAIKYSPPETEVRLQVTQEEDRVKVAVADQGIGMDEKEVRQIFRKFYRTKRAEASGESGTGIGLSIVQQIVTSHGGTIEVISRPGAGSRFTLVLPTAAPVKR